MNLLHYLFLILLECLLLTGYCCFWGLPINVVVDEWRFLSAVLESVLLLYYIFFLFIYLLVDYLQFVKFVLSFAFLFWFLFRSELALFYCWLKLFYWNLWRLLKVRWIINTLKVNLLHLFRLLLNIFNWIRMIKMHNILLLIA